MFGPLPVPPAGTHDEGADNHCGAIGENESSVILPKDTEFPHNVSFRHSDWPMQPIPEDAEEYDVVIACVLTY